MVCSVPCPRGALRDARRRADTDVHRYVTNDAPVTPQGGSCAVTPLPECVTILNATFAPRVRISFFFVALTWQAMGWYSGGSVSFHLTVKLTLNFM